MVNLSEDYHNLRLAVVDFIETLDPASRFYSAFDQGRVSYICSAEALGLPTWEETLEGMKSDGTWFEDSWIQYTAWFLQRDSICHAKNFALIQSILILMEAIRIRSVAIVLRRAYSLHV